VPVFGRNVVLLGLVSLFTDISSEMVARTRRSPHSATASPRRRGLGLLAAQSVAALGALVFLDRTGTGRVSTFTALIDMTSGDVVTDLEQFEITRDGKRFDSIAFNFWGITFAGDERRFYATLSTRGRFYLIEGDVVTRRGRVIADGVECPSLSPDETRIAFKRRRGNEWRLHVLDLETGRETPLAETRKPMSTIRSSGSTTSGSSTAS
jgi:hypothetical protein